VGLLLTGLGVLLLLFLLYFYVFTSLTHSRDQNRLLQSLVGNRRAVYSLVVGHVPSEGAPVAIITIPVLHEQQVVAMGTSPADLQQGPGLMMDTAIPGDPGNAVIAGRRVSYGAPFRSLGRLAPGNRIEVVDGAGRFTFRVVKVSTVPGGYREVVPGRGQSWITLVTSNSPLVDSGNLVVVAKSISPLGRAATAVNRNDRAIRLNLAGDPTSGLLALVWAAMFVLGLWITLRAVRRWRQPWLTYVMSAPLLLACGLFACESLARVLPATL
jgi:sortase A